MYSDPSFFPKKRYIENNQRYQHLFRTIHFHSHWSVAHLFFFFSSSLSCANKSLFVYSNFSKLRAKSRNESSLR